MSLDLSIYVNDDEVFDVNVTHNLNNMARECGLYNVMWRPELHGIRTCKQAIEPLCCGIKELLSNRRKYEKFNPANGWGDYEVLVNTTVKFAMACGKHPDGEIIAHR